MIPLSEERDAFIIGLRKRRAELRLCAWDVSDEIGVDRKTLYNWEQGKSAPTLGHLLLWARALNCKLDVTGR